MKTAGPGWMRGDLFFLEKAARCATTGWAPGANTFPENLLKYSFLSWETGLTIWKFKPPPLKELIEALWRRESAAYYRKASFYEQKFIERFHIAVSDYVAVYEKVYNNRKQRYWLLTPHCPFLPDPLP